MKYFLLFMIFVILPVIVSLYSADKINFTKHQNIKKTSELQKLHQKFSNLYLINDNLNLSKYIKEIKKARQLYPLDDKLKTIEIELENKEANKNYKAN